MFESCRAHRGSTGSETPCAEERAGASAGAVWTSAVVAERLPGMKSSPTLASGVASSGKKSLSMVKMSLVAASVIVLLAAAPVALGVRAATGRTDKEFHFKSPSENIHCRMSYEAVSCLLKANSWTSLKPRPGYCDLDWMPTDIAMYVSEKTGKWVAEVGACRGDVGPLCYSLDPCFVLRSGRSVRSFIYPHKHGGFVLGIRCSSATTGITCIKLGPKRGVRGFRIAREGYVIYR